MNMDYYQEDSFTTSPTHHVSHVNLEAKKALISLLSFFGCAAFPPLIYLLSRG